MNERRSSGPRVALVVAIVVVLLLICAAASGIGVYFWQQASARRLADQVTEAKAREEALQRQVDELTTKVEGLSQPKPPAKTGGGGTSGGGATGASGGATEALTGKYFAFIKSVYKSGGTTYMDADFALFLTGPKAVKAAVEDGFIKPGEPLDNDYYIRNNNKKIRTFPISSGALITLAAPTQSIGLADLVSIFNSSDAYSKQHASAPYWIRLKNGLAVEIQQQYLP